VPAPGDYDDGEICGMIIGRGNEFLSHIVRVTGDETSVSFVNVETKEQSKQRMHTRSPKKPNKFKETSSVRKLMSAVFWDRKGVLMVQFMQQGTTVTSEVYCETLKNCLGLFRKKTWNADIRCSAPP
jgi:hypothetical protein